MSGVTVRAATIRVMGQIPPGALVDRATADPAQAPTGVRAGAVGATRPGTRGKGRARSPRPAAGVRQPIVRVAWTRPIEILVARLARLRSVLAIDESFEEGECTLRVVATDAQPATFRSISEREVAWLREFPGARVGLSVTSRSASDPHPPPDEPDAGIFCHFRRRPE